MSTILTPAEAAAVLRVDEDDQMMLDLLPQVDAYIEQATGRDWTLDSPAPALARAAARMLVVRWYEDPGGMAAGAALGFGLSACLVQLEARALQLATDGAPDENLALVGTNISGEMAVDAAFVLVFNHAMAAGALNQVRLENAAGDTVATVNALDVTGKIMTVTPSADLAAGASYTLVIDHAADIYGQTLDSEIGIDTADV